MNRDERMRERARLLNRQSKPRELDKANHIASLKDEHNGIDDNVDDEEF